MEKELPLFPLNLVAFPGEELNLHIFEPRYKQLINDCLETKTTFGIPSYVMTKIEYGTEVKITEVSKTYDDGRMDIKTVGVRVFEVKNFENPWQNRLYAGGVVTLQPEGLPADQELAAEITELTTSLFVWLQMPEEILTAELTYVDIVHKIGLALEEEYQLLKMTSEPDRQKYIIKHLKKLLPALEQAERAKEKIRMNGHFKHLDPLKF